MAPQGDIACDRTLRDTPALTELRSDHVSAASIQYRCRPTAMNDLSNKRARHRPGKRLPRRPGTRLSAARGAPQSLVLAVRVRQHGDLSGDCSRARRCTCSRRCKCSISSWLSTVSSIGARGGPRSGAVLIRSWTPAQHGLAALAVALRHVVNGWLLTRTPTPSSPYLDSFVTWGSVDHDLDGRAARHRELAVLDRRRCRRSVAVFHLRALSDHGVVRRSISASWSAAISSGVANSQHSNAASRRR